MLRFALFPLARFDGLVQEKSKEKIQKIIFENFIEKRFFSEFV